MYLFWLIVLLVAYTYVGYPLCVWLIAHVVNVKHPKEGDGVDINTVGRVSVIIPAHNEAQHLMAKIQSILTQGAAKYISDIIIADDGSTDNTAEVINCLDDPKIKLITLSRRGKAAALNTAVEVSCGDLLVFTDADNLWLQGTLQALLTPFLNEKVGAVGGKLEFPAIHQQGTSWGDRYYRLFEGWLRQQEDKAGCLINLDGALLIFRKKLWQPVPAGVTDDFFISTATLVAGYQLVWAPHAIVEDHSTSKPRQQFQRRVRITLRGLQSLWVRRSLLNIHQLKLAWALLSHKVLRRVLPLLILLLLPLNLMLLTYGWLFKVFFITQLTGYLITGLVLLLPELHWPKPCIFIAFFIQQLVAMSWAFILFVCGHRVMQWTPDAGRQRK
ncbi:glycosyltransferase [Zooshikella harenae]|uniref:Glycosyltransferase n=1 Tax=Zooshikella harenae TaxID=2827238 RepID=A0ABS5ZG58_9GAMM|nr:glycosyltransferase [Zooshikella harenae]MBU2712758.1 glycosyltransferase [Zooshikella harenae]